MKNPMTKLELRNHIRSLKRAMAEEAIVEKSAILAKALFDTQLYRDAKTIYGYVSYNQEVRTLPILEQALRDGKRIALAKCYGDDMRFIQVSDLNTLSKSKSGVPEPVADSPLGNDETALVLMPGLAFDTAGHRLGYGRGYYDKFLASEPNHPTVALCFDFQMLEHIAHDDHDVPVDLVLWA